MSTGELGLTFLIISMVIVLFVLSVSLIQLAAAQTRKLNADAARDEVDHG